MNVYRWNSFKFAKEAAYRYFWSYIGVYFMHHQQNECMSCNLCKLGFPTVFILVMLLLLYGRKMGQEDPQKEKRMSEISWYLSYVDTLVIRIR
jgi:hypothetical protein